MNKKRWSRKPWQLIQCDRDRFRNLKAFCSRGCAGCPPVSPSAVIQTGWRGGEDGSILHSGCTGSSSNTRQQVMENQNFCHSIPRRVPPLLPPSFCCCRSLCLRADEQRTSSQIRYSSQAPHATKSSSNTSWGPGRRSPGLCEEIMQ